MPTSYRRQARFSRPLSVQTYIPHLLIKTLLTCGLLPLQVHACGPSYLVIATSPSFINPRLSRFRALWETLARRSHLGPHKICVLSDSLSWR